MTPSQTATQAVTLAEQLETTSASSVFIASSAETAEALEPLVTQSGKEVLRSLDGATPEQVLVLARGGSGAQAVLSNEAAARLRLFFVHEARNELLPLLAAGYRFGREVPLQGGALLRQGRRGDYAIARYRDGDEADILGLFRSAFHVERGVDHWRWKYRDCPYGAARISVVRDADGQLVGQYCAYPVPFVARGETTTRTVHQVGDTMTAPAVRAVGRGHSSLLASTAQHFYGSFCRDQVEFNFGFNTGNIRKFSTRFVGAEEIENVRFRVAQRDQVDTRRRLLAPKAQREDGFGDEFDEFFQRARPLYGALLVRDARYLDWRYARRPDLEYRWFTLRRRRVLGWGVFCRRETTLVWGDALFERDAARHAPELLRAALASFEAEGPIERIVGWFPDRPDWWHQTLQSLGFVEAEEPQELGLVAVPFLTPREELVERLRNDLYYTYGDSDLF